MNGQKGTKREYPRKKIKEIPPLPLSAGGRGMTGWISIQ
jgi:hypothetical protein